MRNLLKENDIIRHDSEIFFLLEESHSFRVSLHACLDIPDKKKGTTLNIELRLFFLKAPENEFVCFFYHGIVFCSFWGNFLAASSCNLSKLKERK